MSTIIPNVVITGSGFDRAEICPPSTFLPRVNSTGSRYAERGTAIHKYLALVAEVGEEAALALTVEEFRPDCAAIDLTKMPHSNPKGWGFEVAFAWDSVNDTARELYRGSGARNYGVQPKGVYCGTADIIGLSQDGTEVIALDVKNTYLDLGDPEKSLQLGFCAVAAALTFGATRAVVGFIRMVDGEPRFIVGFLDEMALEAMKERLIQVVDNAQFEAEAYAESGDVTPTESKHCVYCPAFARCPRNATLFAQALATPEPADEFSQVVTINESNAAMVYERIEAVKRIVKHVEKTLDEYARKSPFQLADGNIYGEVECSTETIIAAKAKEIFPPEFFNRIAVTETTITKARLTEVIGETAAKGKKAGEVREALAHLRHNGALKESFYMRVKASKPSKK